MAVTRKFLKGMGLTDEQVDTIIEAHTETVDGLKDDLKKAEEKAAKLDGIQKELDDLKDGDYKGKYEKEHQDFEAYKADVTAKETRTAKENAAKAYFESKNITGSNLEIAMRGAREEIGSLEIDGGKIKDTAALDALVAGTYAGLVVTTTKQGVHTATPPSNNGKATMTKAEILAIKDAGERQQKIAENHELFGI